MVSLTRVRTHAEVCRQHLSLRYTVLVPFVKGEVVKLNAGDKTSRDVGIFVAERPGGLAEVRATNVGVLDILTATLWWRALWPTSLLVHHSPPTAETMPIANATTVSVEGPHPIQFLLQQGNVPKIIDYIPRPHYQKHSAQRTKLYQPQDIGRTLRVEEDLYKCDPYYVRVDSGPLDLHVLKSRKPKDG